MKRLLIMAVAVVALAGCYLAPNPGASGARWMHPDAVPQPTNGDASFRVECARSHYGKIDPIVSPGVEAMHNHVFFGNTGITKDSTAASIATTGNSTCEGGTLNRTGYWVPAMEDTAHNRAVLDTAPIAGALQVYYKSGYRGVHSASVETFPAGLRMIAGDVATNPKETYWDCIRTPSAQDVIGHPTRRVLDWQGNLVPQTRFWSIPDHCGPGQYIQLTVEFPQCGQEDELGNPVLDSPDHRSHMAYADDDPWVPEPDPENPTCPEGYPVVYPQVTEHSRWMVPIEGTPKMPHDPDCLAGGWAEFDQYDWQGNRGWGDPSTWPGAIEGCDLWPHQIEAVDLELSSDPMMGNGEPGDSAHADWFYGWHQPTFDAVVDVCFHEVEANCQLGLVPFPIGEAPIPNAPVHFGYEWAKLAPATP